MTRLATTFPLLLLAAGAPALAQALDPDWRDGAVCYEVFVRSFFDSDGDGIGDLNGLIAKLDYINDGDAASRTDLGATCIWLMPITQATAYHGYDVTNYFEVDRAYGTNADFRRLVDEAHRRGIAIIFDLVLNHTSSEHPYFRSAFLDPDSPWRDWYIWAPEPLPSPGWTAPVWHRAHRRDEHYYGLFWHGMPDLNLANPDVFSETERIARFWIEEMGVDGFRLDAVSHFFEQDGRWKHVPATHAWLRDYAAALRRMDPDVYTVGEVYDSTGALLAYYPDQLESYFEFDIADAIIDAVRSGSGDRLMAAVQRAGRDLPAGRYATFLRNHDQTRTMTELGGDYERARLAATLLLTLPGLPYVYYGEEIGMTGSKSDGDPRLRTPMHWSLERAAGFSDGLPWEPLRPDSFTANVAVQESDTAALLNHYRRMIPLRRSEPALYRGVFTPLRTSVTSAIAYLRRGAEGENVLVVANLSAAPIGAFDIAHDRARLPSVDHSAEPLLGPPLGGRVRVGRDQRLRARVPALAPFEARVYRLTTEGSKR